MNYQNTFKTHIPYQLSEMTNVDFRATKILSTLRAGIPVAFTTT